MTITLHYYLHPENGRSHKIIAAAAFAGVKLEQKMVVYPATEEFKKNCSPLGGNPVLETPDGFVFESNAIMRHIARLDTTGALYGGRTLYENSTVDAWLDLCCSELDPLSAHISKIYYYQRPLPADFVADSELVFAGIEQWIENRTYLVGERITIADICVAFSLQPFYRLSGHGEHFSTKFPNVFRLYNAVMKSDAIAAALKAVGGSDSILTAAEAAAAMVFPK